MYDQRLFFIYFIYTLTTTLLKSELKLFFFLFKDTSTDVLHRRYTIHINTPIHTNVATTRYNYITVSWSKLLKMIYIKLDTYRGPSDISFQVQTYAENSILPAMVRSVFSPLCWGITRIEPIYTGGIPWRQRII